MLATSSHKGTPVWESDLRGPVVILIGGEGAGIPKSLLAQADDVVAIPQANQVESLNAGIAASVVLYEAARQRKVKALEPV
jgi:tRNA G18 (ribose-2'-O)-methylase SpoU